MKLLAQAKLAKFFPLVLLIEEEVIKTQELLFQIVEIPFYLSCQKLKQRHVKFLLLKIKQAFRQTSLDALYKACINYHPLWFQVHNFHPCPMNRVDWFWSFPQFQEHNNNFHLQKQK